MSSERNSVTPYRWLAGALIALLFGAAVGRMGASAADSAAPVAAEKAVTLETVAGSPVKRVTLSAKAAERLDLKTGEVSEQAIVPTLMVGGIVVDPSAAGPAGTAASAGNKKDSESWLRVPMSQGEWTRLAKDKPVRILPLATRSGLAADLTASPSGVSPLDNAKSGMLSAFFVVRSGGSGLVQGDRVRVELQLEGTADKQKVVPYSAVYYDAKGDAWVYVQTAPFTFVRQRITVERVAGSLAVLTNGPEAGTKVATVGVSLLYGAELFGK